MPDLWSGVSMYGYLQIGDLFGLYFIFSKVLRQKCTSCKKHKCTNKFSRKTSGHISITCNACHYPTCQCGVKYKGSIPAQINTVKGGVWKCQKCRSDQIQQLVALLAERYIMLYCVAIGADTCVTKQYISANSMPLYILYLCHVFCRDAFCYLRHESMYRY